MAISYISPGTLAQLATLTNVGAQADDKKNTHCPANLITNNSSQCLANNISQYGTVYTTQVSFSGRCTGYYSSNG